MPRGRSLWHAGSTYLSVEVNSLKRHLKVPEELSACSDDEFRHVFGVCEVNLQPEPARARTHEGAAWAEEVASSEALWQRGDSSSR
eukprot:6713444-Alexandrium_andersonii.AAC.1